MGYDYTKKISPVGQFDQNACWAASISWWTRAMMENFKRKHMTQTELISKFNYLCDEDTGGMTLAGFRTVCGNAEIKINLEYISPTTFKKYAGIDLPMIIVFNYPVIGGTHMNVVFNQKGSTVACMEPYFPFPGQDGKRSGKYIRRDMNFFANSQQIGVGSLPLEDAFYQQQ